MTITKRADKGIALTYGELDENFRDLDSDMTLDRVLKNGNSSARSLSVDSADFTNITVNNGIIMPNRPAFSAAIDRADNADIPAGYLDGFEVVHFNRGSHFNATTGVFTAPLDGLYHFTYQNIHNNLTLSATDVSLELNPANFSTDTAPTQINSGNPRTVIRVRRDVDATNWNTLGFSVPLYMNQNDFVVVYMHNGTTTDNHNYGANAYFNNFSGYYIG